VGKNILCKDYNTTRSRKYDQTFGLPMLKIGKEGELTESKIKTKYQSGYLLHLRILFMFNSCLEKLFYFHDVFLICKIFFYI
jgi:hypothetical protein